MLFSSPVFLLFLLITLTGFYALLHAGKSRSAQMHWLLLASLFFYGWWDVRYLGLLLALTTLNYLLGEQLRHRPSRVTLALGVGWNLMVLGYFKYANFFVEEVSQALALDWHIRAVVLPLGISFYTFQKMAYLVDANQGKLGRTGRMDFADYTLFVSFFPQLIAGPIVHHAEMMPQFVAQPGARKRVVWWMLGVAVFSIGLWKKLCLADPLGEFAAPVFSKAAAGGEMLFFESWMGVLGYSLQLYFDFSGYSDMAIGLGLMFAIRLPVNFYSPYQATSMIDFWRRWHMTLSRFFRDYVYIPLGGNRHGHGRQQVNLLMVMLLCGFWHGAGWNFLFWGGWHGVALLVNHQWRASIGQRLRMPALMGWGITLMWVILGWVMFRAADMGSTVRIWQGMLALHGVDVPLSLLEHPLLRGWAHPFDAAGNTTLLFWRFMVIGVAAVIALFLPNLVRIFRHWPIAVAKPDVHRQGGAAMLRWRFGWWAGIGLGMLWAMVLKRQLAAQPSEFLYFQF